MEAIFEYVSFNLTNREAALSLIHTFEDSFKYLILFPESCPVINDDRLLIKDMRKCVVKNYLVVYRVNYEKNIIEIFRVLYQKENYL